MTNGLDMDTIATQDDDLDIDSLNDSQLFEKLKENNIVAGPIVDSTREIYKKKLKKVLYGVDEESFVSGGKAELVNDQEYEDEIVADKEEDETVEDGNLTGPILEKEDGEEVVDGVTESQYESKSDTDEDQPSGVSRHVDTPSGLRKRVHGNDAESNEATDENDADPQPDVKPNTWPLVLAVVFLMIVVGVAVANYCLNVDMSDIEDPFREVPAQEEVLTEAANKAAQGVD